jgi:hypothetical protein
LKEIENVEEERSVDGMREREGHLVDGGGKEVESTISGEEFTSAPFRVYATCYVIPLPVGRRGALNHHRIRLEDRDASAAMQGVRGIFVAPASLLYDGFSVFLDTFRGPEDRSFPSVCLIEGIIDLQVAVVSDSPAL